MSHTLDVSSDTSVAALLAAHPGVDILINNAGVYPQGAPTETGAASVLETLNTNTVGAHRLSLAYAPGMRGRGWGRIVNVSSDMGQSANWNAYALSYRVSKAALNALTVGWADELRGSGVLVNATDPGWVQTRMGAALPLRARCSRGPPAFCTP